MCGHLTALAWAALLRAAQLALRMASPPCHHDSHRVKNCPCAQKRGAGSLMPGVRPPHFGTAHTCSPFGQRPPFTCSVQVFEPYPKQIGSPRFVQARHPRSSLGVLGVPFPDPLPFLPLLGRLLIRMSTSRRRINPPACSLRKGLHNVCHFRQVKDFLKAAV